MKIPRELFSNKTFIFIVREIMLPSRKIFQNGVSVVLVREPIQFFEPRVEHLLAPFSL